MLTGTWKAKTVLKKFYRRTRTLLGVGIESINGNKYATLFSVMNSFKDHKVKGD